MTARKVLEDAGGPMSMSEIYDEDLKRVYLYAVIYDSIRTQKTTIDSKKCFSKVGPGVFDLFDREKSETTY